MEVAGYIGKVGEREEGQEFVRALSGARGGSSVPVQ